MTKSIIGARGGAVFASFALALLLSGCSSSFTEVRGMWASVAENYPECKVMPKVVMLDGAREGGYYHPASHTVFIDKYASAEVWKHEFAHACGDTLGEAYVNLNDKHTGGTREGSLMLTDARAK